jgi:hypothetical protein
VVAQEIRSCRPCGSSVYRLLDVKEAIEAAGPYAKNAGMPRNNAERVVAACIADAESLDSGSKATAQQGIRRSAMAMERGVGLGCTSRGGLPGTLLAVRPGKIPGK